MRVSFQEKGDWPLLTPPGTWLCRRILRGKDLNPSKSCAKGESSLEAIEYPGVKKRIVRVADKEKGRAIVLDQGETMESGDLRPSLDFLCREGVYLGQLQGKRRKKSRVPAQGN